MVTILRSVRRRLAALGSNLRAIHAQEDRQAAREKARQVVEKLESMKLSKAATIVREGVEETLSHMAFPRRKALFGRSASPKPEAKVHHSE
jgi:hypothetical protein